MRALVWIAAGLAVLWLALWGGARLALDRVAPAMAARGAIVRHEGERLTVWPLSLRAQWQGPQVVTARAHWRGDHLAAALPLSRPGWMDTDLSGHQDATIMGLPVTLDTDQLTASARVRPLPPLPLRAFRAHLAAGHLTAGGIPMVKVARADAEITLQPGATDAQITAQVTGVQPLLRQATPEIAAIGLAARADLDRPATVMDPPARLRSLTLDALTVDWNGAALSLAGGLSVTPDGQWEGQLTLTGTNWAKALEAAVIAGLMEQGIADTWAGLARALGATDDALDLPLKVSGGQVWLGLLPLARLPAMAPPRP